MKVNLVLRKNRKNGFSILLCSHLSSNQKNGCDTVDLKTDITFQYQSVCQHEVFVNE